jgi:hypothetical protein
MDHDKITIVGPENSILGPEPINGSSTGQKKVNIEAFLLMAKYDNEFARLVFTDRQKAIKESEIEFTKSEEFLLSSLTDKQLRKNIESLRISGVTKKSLPSWKKATAVIMLLATIFTTTLSSCRTQVSRGIEPTPTNTVAPKETTPS